MRIGITGASGFIGRHVAEQARSKGHEVVTYSRRPANHGLGDPCALIQPKTTPWMLPEPEHPLDAIVHLSGEPVLGLWTEGKRQRIRDSRVAYTKQLVSHLNTWKQPPAIFASASGVGIYGDRGSEELDEHSSAGRGFLTDVCCEWETAANGARALFGARVLVLRTGLVLGDGGGALPLMRRAFKFGLGGRLGKGSQWMPWIHIRDEAGLILWALEKSELDGPVNLASPNPVTNAEFTRELARTLGRPAFFHVPAGLLRMLLGDLAREMLLCSQRVIPRKALDSGYAFQFTHLTPALAQLLAHP